MYVWLLFWLLSFACVVDVQSAITRPIRIISSSTAYHLMAIASEEFGQTTEFRAPTVEVAGTGRAINLFCSGGINPSYNVVVASRRIRESELLQCKASGISEVEESVLGYDGIIMANSPQAPKMNLDYDHLFKALIASLPHEGSMQKNFYHNWRQISTTLPDMEILIYGPMTGSGTRQIFSDLLMRNTCMGHSDIRMLYKNPDELEKVCSKIRSDGSFVEYDESVGVVLRKMQSDDKTIAIVSYGVLEQNHDYLQTISIEGVEPTLNNIANGSYKVVRPVYMYVNKGDIGNLAGLDVFIKEITSDNAIGKYGYLATHGLISLQYIQEPRQSDNSGGVK